MATVIVPSEVAAEIRTLPLGIQARMDRLVARLADCPQVSGAKRLTGKLAGKYRLRTGDYRLQFRVNEKKRLTKQTKKSTESKWLRKKRFVNTP